MRKLFFLVPLVLVACGGNGGDGGFSAPGTAPPAGAHVPEISNLTLSPASAMYMAGDGSITVTAQLAFQDTGLDIQTLWVAMPDGSNLEYPKFSDTETGTLTAEFAMSTEVIGAFTVEVWLMDKAGDNSNQLNVDFFVLGNVGPGEWTSRLSGLPYVLNDVIYDGEDFIAVGGNGTVLTSANGIDWLERETFTDADLNALAFDAADIVAVGDDSTVLLSSDNGVSWSVLHSGDPHWLHAVAVTPSQIVVGGMDKGLGTAIVGLSENRGETWTVVDSWPSGPHFLTDLVYVDGLYVAATDVFDWQSDARVAVSTEGKVWNDIILRDEVAASYALLHDGTQFVAAGSHNTVFVSVDAYNWTELQTPVHEVDYLSAAWNGSKLVVAGGITWWYWWGGITPSFERPVGISSTDGGQTWEIFNIDGYYQSRGMAWGDGRFVSVGQTTPVSGEGAIYTSDN